jgi:hypothetical protein
MSAAVDNRRAIEDHMPIESPHRIELTKAVALIECP